MNHFIRKAVNLKENTHLSPKFDPILHMSKQQISCRKYHYSVPISYGDDECILSYQAKSKNFGYECLKIYAVDK